MEQFVTFEIAKKLNDKGFDSICSRYYSVDDKKLRRNEYWAYEERINAPTISQVLKWLREEKKIYIGISYMPKIINETGILNDFYYPTFQKIGLFEPMFFIGGNDTYDNYEEAAMAGIEFILNNLI